MSDSEHDNNGRYNDGNRAFLQSFLARGTFTYEEARPVIAAIVSIQEGKIIYPKDISERDHDMFIDKARVAVQHFDYEIRNARSQVNRERVWALVNTISDPLTQMATMRTPDEIAYIKRFLDAMFESYNTKRKEVMAVSGMQTLEVKLRKGAPNRESNGAAGTQSQAADKGLTTDQTEKLLGNLVKEKWISKGRSGYYILTPRALLELRDWLVDTYNDPDEDDDAWQKIKKCWACKEIITLGQRCSNLDCNIRLHNVCEDAYWRSRPKKECPKCHTTWDSKHFVGTKVATNADKYLREKRRSGIGEKRRREDNSNGGEGSSREGRRIRVQDEEEGEEGEEEEEEEGQEQDAEREAEDDDAEEPEEEEGGEESEAEPQTNGRRDHRAVGLEEEDEDE